VQKFSNGNLIHHSHSRVVQNKKKSQGIVREGESSAAWAPPAVAAGGPPAVAARSPARATNTMNQLPVHDPDPSLNMSKLNMSLVKQERKPKEWSLEHTFDISSPN